MVAKIPLDYAKAFNDLKFQIMGPSKLRKIAAAQAEAGGTRAALDWIVRLDATSDIPDYLTAKADKEDRKWWSRVVANNRIEARLGIVDGILKHAKSDNR